MLWLLLGLLLACALSSWLLPDSALARSAARAFDTSVLLLGRGGDDDEVDDDAAARPASDDRCQFESGLASDLAGHGRSRNATVGARPDGRHGDRR